MLPVRCFPWLVTFLFLACILAIPLCASLGPWPIGLGDCLHYILPAPTPEAEPGTACTIVRQIRLPRCLAALLCGASLSLAGCLLQGVLRNPLADPFTMGISAGAACGASITIATAAPLLELLPLSLSLLISCGALVGALLALLSALLLGHGRGGLSRENVILAGIAVAAFLGSIVALVKALNEESVTSIVFWILGSLQGIAWQSLPLLLLFLIPGLLAALWGWQRLDVLSLGDEEATALGVYPARCRFWLLLGASCMTAGCVAITGVIGFVGLVVPHILRILLGGAHGLLLLASLPAGALFLLLADTAARTVLDGGQELPVGVVTALVGAPFFGFLIWRHRSSHD